VLWVRVVCAVFGDELADHVGVSSDDVVTESDVELVERVLRATIHVGGLDGSEALHDALLHLDRLHPRGLFGEHAVGLHFGQQSLVDGFLDLLE
jgi:hypothetical protein